MPDHRKRHLASKADKPSQAKIEFCPLVQKRPKYCSAKNERNCQKRSDHTRFRLHFMSWVPSVRFPPLGQLDNADRAKLSLPTYSNYFQFKKSSNLYKLSKPVGHNGPERCIGVPVVRHDAATLGELLGYSFELIESRRHDHQTPTGATQRFQFSRFRRI